MSVAELKLAELNSFGKLTLQSIGEFLNIEGYEDMKVVELIQAIEDYMEDMSFVVNNELLVGDLVPPF